MSERDGPPPLHPEHVLAVREGHGANCSSVGSVIDTLFATAAVGSAVLAAVLAALAERPPTEHAGPGPVEPPPPDRRRGPRDA